MAHPLLWLILFFISATGNVILGYALYFCLPDVPIEPKPTRKDKYGLKLSRDLADENAEWDRGDWGLPAEVLPADKDARPATFGTNDLAGNEWTWTGVITPFVGPPRL